VDQKLNQAAGVGAMDENLLGLANPMSTISIGRDDIVGEDRPGAGLSQSVKDFVAEGGRAKLKQARDAKPATAPSTASLAPAETPRAAPRPSYDDEPDNDVADGRKG
jgi:hypothetical protein